MPYCHFLLTYSVQARSSARRYTEKAEEVRRDIAEVDIWEKMSDVETTFRGEVYIGRSADTDRQRMRWATEHAESVFEPFLEKAHATENDVIIQCVMMVEGAAKRFYSV